jgi:DNA-binding XRE family transcriptional regulator
MSEILKTIKDRCKEDGECWMWQQAVNNKGYPQMAWKGRSGVMVRRLAYEASGRRLNGSRWAVISTCGEVTCCNPDHLKQVTRSVVIANTYKDGRRNVAGEVHARRVKAIEQGWSKLDFEKVSVIRKRMQERAGMSKAQKMKAELTNAAMARAFGVSEKAIYSIERGRCWVTEPAPANSIFALAEAA